MQQPFSLQGRVALITGGGTGIGLDIAKCFLASGATVIITGRRVDVLKEAIANLGAWAHYAVNDVSELSKTESFVAEITAKYGNIDILVNNAGINMKRPAVEVSDADFANIINVNLNAVFALTREVGKHMLERGKGSIIMISSMAAYYGIGMVRQRGSRECDCPWIYRNGDESDGDEFRSGSETQGDGSHAHGLFWETRGHRLGGSLFSFGCIKLRNRRLNPG